MQKVIASTVIFLVFVFMQLPLPGKTMTVGAAGFHLDPGPDTEAVWSSLQFLVGTWTSNGEQFMRWEKYSDHELRKIHLDKEGKEKEQAGRLIKEGDRIRYELKSQGEVFTLLLQKGDKQAWTFAAVKDQLLQAIELHQDEKGALRTEMIAVSPSGRRMTIHSQLEKLPSAVNE